MFGLGLGALNLLVPCPAICSKCRCNFGPYTAWTTIRPFVVNAVKTARKKYPGYPLVVTGYSIGASQAVFAAAEFRTNNTGVTSMYNYGQQRSGDTVFANYITAQGNNYRITHTSKRIFHPVQSFSKPYGYINQMIPYPDSRETQLKDSVTSRQNTGSSKIMDQLRIIQ